MYYMFNVWCLDEAIKIFGDNLGRHIFGKFIDRDDTLRFYSELDNECRAKIVERADAYYGNK